MLVSTQMPSHFSVSRAYSISLRLASTSVAIATLDAPVRAALRMGAYEKLYARTAAHAAVHQAVEVVGAPWASKRPHGDLVAGFPQHRRKRRTGAAAVIQPAACGSQTS